MEVLYVEKQVRYESISSPRVPGCREYSTDLSLMHLKQFTCFT